MTADDILLRPAGELARMVSEREVSPAELMRSSLERIEALDATLHAFLTVAHDTAVREAEEAEAAVLRGSTRGPLHGLPVGVKDVIPTAGLRTTYGSRQLLDNVPREDALVVERVRRAGGIVIGKTSTPEFAAYMNTTNEIVGTTRNPWRTDLSSGGSSGGSAVALATGMCALALGTDHGGSVRVPAAMNGVVGLRPTPGLVPALPTAWSQDVFDVIGPMARTVDDVSLLLRAVAGPDPRVPISLRVHRGLGPARDEELGGWRIAWTPDLGGLLDIDAQVRATAERAAQRFTELGASVEDASPKLGRAVSSIGPLRMLRGLIEHHERLGQLEDIENVLLRNMLEKAAGTPMGEAARAYHDLTLAWTENLGFFDRYRLLLTPTTQVVAFGHDELAPRTINGVELAEPLSAGVSTYAISMMGWPALTVPCGSSVDGVPIGLQVVGPPGAEWDVLHAGRLFEASFGLKRRPPILDSVGG